MLVTLISFIERSIYFSVRTFIANGLSFTCSSDSELSLSPFSPSYLLYSKKKINKNAKNTYSFVKFEDSRTLSVVIYKLSIFINFCNNFWFVFKIF